MVVMLSVHPSRVGDLVAPENITCDPPQPIHYYHDSFGNFCGRLIVPPGGMKLHNRATVRDSGLADAVMPDAQQIPIENLPDEIIQFLLPSRYCEIDRMMDIAWVAVRQYRRRAGRACRRFATTCITTSPLAISSRRRPRARHDVHADCHGVCRDFAHLAVTAMSFA